MQESFLALLEDTIHLEQGSENYPLFCGTVRNKTLMGFRSATRRQRHERGSGENTTVEAGADQLCEQNELARILWEELHKLSREERWVLKLSLADRTQEEIAKRLHTSVRTVKRWKMDGLQKLRAALESRGLFSALLAAAGLGVLEAPRAHGAIVLARRILATSVDLLARKGIRSWAALKGKAAAIFLAVGLGVGALCMVSNPKPVPSSPPCPSSPPRKTVHLEKKASNTAAMRQQTLDEVVVPRLIRDFESIPPWPKAKVTKRRFLERDKVVVVMSCTALAEMVTVPVRLEYDIKKGELLLSHDKGDGVWRSVDPEEPLYWPLPGNRKFIWGKGQLADMRPAFEPLRK